MITYLDGTLVEKAPTRIVVDVGGVGYEVSVALSSYDKLPAVNERCRILTYDHVREDAHTLFGFATAEERGLFVRLLDVTGIGPKTALGALSGMTVREIKAAIVEGDVKRLSAISGIGKKTAERIIVELRDKFGAGEALEAVAGAQELSAEDVRIRDAMLALVSLGYKQADALKRVQAAAARLKAGSGVEDIVRQALSG